MSTRDVDSFHQSIERLAVGFRDDGAPANQKPSAGRPLHAPSPCRTREGAIVTEYKPGASGKWCPCCAFTEAGSEAQRRVLDVDVVPTIDTLMCALIEQKVSHDASAQATRAREIELEQELKRAGDDLADAKAEVRELTQQVNTMTETLIKMQPILQKANYYRRALKEARRAIERIEGVASDSELRSIIERSLSE